MTTRLMGNRLPLDAPEQYLRRILLAVTGLSPQIVTETLYALAVTSTPPFLPTEIHLLTTTEGAERARISLLHPDGGKFHTFLADYPEVGLPSFDSQHIHVIRDENGKSLSDIRTPEENASAADAITALVAGLTRDEHAALHVSIAGGRKTMGFYLGYAFSLFARPQDQLSHVLVAPKPFESHPEFFYPPPKPQRLRALDGHHIDTAQARVTLAKIPVVRLRHGLPVHLQQGHASYNETVATVQESFSPPHLVIDTKQGQVFCGRRGIPLPPALLAWIEWWAQMLLSGQPMLNWREANADQYLEIYTRVVGRDAQALERTQKRLKDGMEKEFFEQNNSKLNKALRDQLGPAATPYLIGHSGARPNTRRGLTLTRSAVSVK